MIGVTPLPALMKSIFSGSGSGSTNAPSTSLSVTIVPGRSCWLTYGETTPSSTNFGVIETKPSSRSVSEVSE